MTVDRRAIHLYNDYIHGSMARRDFLARLIGIAGSAAAATALLSVLEPNHAHARQVAEHDPRVHAERVRYPGVDGPVNAYLARPATPSGPLPAVLVIHENRGLNPHIEDVARRLALAGYLALAPDGLSVAGGAPTDQEQARDLFAATDRARIDADVMAGIPFLSGSALTDHGGGNGRVGAVGFCYGGGIALRCAAEFPDATGAAVCFYGRALTAEQVARVKAPLTLHYAGEDPRINADIPEFRRVLDANRVAYSLHMYPGTQHGFHNDASAARYDPAAAALAWQRTLAFFDHHLKS
ncbi:MAG TPA: carboxymethylenebutenolidase [Xanthomonadales bacterium]|nr:carboxymethylenebutenolidase [Xanthomonadales bacterium]